jgi:hypothetical protein
MHGCATLSISDVRLIVRMRANARTCTSGKACRKYAAAASRVLPSVTTSSISRIRGDGNGDPLTANEWKRSSTVGRFPAHAVADLRTAVQRRSPGQTAMPNPCCSSASASRSATVTKPAAEGVLAGTGASVVPLANNGANRRPSALSLLTHNAYLKKMPAEPAFRRAQSTREQRDAGHTPPGE